MIKIKRAGKFDQSLKELVKKNPKLLDLIEEKILLFREKPTDTRLGNHPLKRRLDGKWAFSITSNVRIVYEWQGKRTVRFLIIGEHKAVYKKS